MRFPKIDFPGRPTFGRGGFGGMAAEEVGRLSFGSLRESENAPVVAERGFAIFGFFKRCEECTRVAVECAPPPRNFAAARALAALPHGLGL